MKIPVYVATGFLEAGKTTFLNQLLSRPQRENIRVLMLQFEEGEEDFTAAHESCSSVVISKAELQQQPEQIVEQIGGLVAQHRPHEIWVEWNGMTPFAELQAIFLQPILRRLCRIHKVIHIADVQAIGGLLGKTGAALPEQIASSDFVFARGGRAPEDYQELRRTLRGLNPGIDLYDRMAYETIIRKLREKRLPIPIVVLFAFLAVGLLQMVVLPGLRLLEFPVNAWMNVFLGITLQAVPFLLIGVLLSSMIQVFLPKEWIEKHFPKSIGMGTAAAILAGFCLPVCDCASIPLFRSFVKKGIPLSAAVTFMTAAPVINPVVMLSTYYAFGGDIKMVACRVSFGIIAAVLIGLSFALRVPKEEILSGSMSEDLLCSCGCYETPEVVTTRWGKVGLFLRHAQADFFQVGKFLLIGTFVSALFQVFSTQLFSGMQVGTGRAAAILVMMLMAFAFSLCSSADAVIARTLLGQFPPGAVFGFLVFGPMIDIKNVLMLSSGFTKRFIVRLSVTAFIICFAVVFIFTSIGGL